MFHNTQQTMRGSDVYLQVLHEEFAQIVQSLQFLSDGILQALEIGARLFTPLHALTVKINDSQNL